MDIYETESEINKLESEIEKYDERISAVDEKLPKLEEVSDITGIVQEVQQDLSNPVLTIASAENKVQGMLTEKEQALIEPGMEVSISLKNKSKTYKGTIEQVSHSPKEEPEVEKESQYPFTAVLDEPIDRMGARNACGRESRNRRNRKRHHSSLSSDQKNRQDQASIRAE